MGDSIYNSNGVKVAELKGLDEREEFSNPDPGVFPYLRGMVPTDKGTLAKCNGIKLYQRFDSPVLTICQTNDARRNVIIQTQSKIYIQSEEEFFGLTPYAPSLTTITIPEEDTMPRAVIAHSLASGTNAASYNVANAWQQAPLDATFVSQLNADGTAAAFATVAANQITLAAGVYRIKGWSVMSCTNATQGRVFGTRLYNVTAAAAAWAGAANENSFSPRSSVQFGNTAMHFAGELNLAVPTTFEVQGNCTTAAAVTNFGGASNLAGAGKEIYRWMEIIKTA